MRCGGGDREEAAAKEAIGSPAVRVRAEAITPTRESTGEKLEVARGLETHPCQAMSDLQGHRTDLSANSDL